MLKRKRDITELEVTSPSKPKRDKRQKHQKKTIMVDEKRVILDEKKLNANLENNSLHTLLLKKKSLENHFISLFKKNYKQEPISDQKLSVLDRLPTVLQRHALSFLLGGHIEHSKTQSGFCIDSSLKRPFFFEYRASCLALTVMKAMQNLAHRINVNKTLEFMQENPSILQTLPFPVEITDRGGRRIKRASIMGALVALDEFDVIEVKTEAKPCALIPTVFSWFNDEKDPKNCHIKKQLQEQLGETAGPNHEHATKERGGRYLMEIENFIKQVINCKDTSNGPYDVPFETLMSHELVQNFIKTAFKPDPNDPGELGIVWDGWQLYFDFIKLLENYGRYEIQTQTDNINVADKSWPDLGGLCLRKVDVIEEAVWLAFLRVCEYGHLEVAMVGPATVSVKHPPVRFDCSKLPDILDGIGDTHFFGFFFGDKRSRGARAGLAWPGLGIHYEIFVRQKHQHYTAYAARATHQEEQLSDPVEIRRSPSVTAAKR